MVGLATKLRMYEAAVQRDKKDTKVQVATFMASTGHEALQIFKTLGLSEEEKRNSWIRLKVSLLHILHLR